MRSKGSVKDLAAEMAKRHNEGRKNSFNLFLGAACARAANVPPTAEIARQAFRELYDGDPEAANKYLLEQDWEDERKLVEAFYNLLGDISVRQRYRMLQRFYTSIPVPLFYQDLAVLIQAGYFNHVLTTNVDTLLERALTAAALRYQIIDLSMDRRAETPFTDISYYPIKIFKLYTDPTDKHVPTCKEIEATLKSQGISLKDELMNDIVMVGYEFECKPISRWLTKPTDGLLWWVGDGDRYSKQMSSIQSARHVIYIDELSTNLETIFGKLVLMLLRMPILEAMSTSFEDYAASLSPGGISSKISPSEDELEVEYLRGQLQRSQEILYGLRQGIASGKKSVALQNQIEYQERQIAELEKSLQRQQVESAYRFG